MKRRIWLIILWGLALLSGCVGPAASSGEEVEFAPPPTPPVAEATALPLQTCQGILYAFDENTVTIKDSAGQLFLFPLAKATITATERGLRAGYPAEATYLGGEAGQNRLFSLTVEDFSSLSQGEIAACLTATMSRAEKVGQMFLSTRLGTDGVETTRRWQPGGYVLFASFFRERNPQQVRELLTTWQEAASTPLLLAVDEEGGCVLRVSCFPQYRAEPFLSPAALYSQGLAAVTTETQEKCALLRSLGLNVNLAPVCDISTSPADYIYERTVGLGAEEVSSYATTVVKAMAGSGVGCALKHFPGYGGSSDTHQGLAYDGREYELFTAGDLLPFAAGIQAGAGAVLVAHNIVACLDPQAPASLSFPVHTLLREELGFQGVVITDDLSMKAIQAYCSDQEAAVQAVLAGNDLLCCGDMETQLPAVLTAIEEGVIDEARIDQSVERILRWKMELGIFHVE